MGDVQRIERRGEVQPQPRRPSVQRRTGDEDAVAFEIEHNGEKIRALAAGIDRKHLRELERGEFDFDCRFDLHGYDSNEARRLLTDELLNAMKAGARRVLIIHGRGLHSDDGPVLKTAVTEWLTAPPLAPRIMAFASAPPSDGGTGATAVLLRRSRQGAHS